MQGIIEHGKTIGIWQVEKFNVPVDSFNPGELAEFWREIRSGRLKPHEVLQKASVGI